MRGLSPAAGLAMWLAAGLPAWAEEPRYVASWVDGTQTQGEEVEDWHRAAGRPSLAGRPLFDDAHPLRSLVDRTLPRSPRPVSYLEFHGGDRLPGRVVGYADHDETPGVPAHLVVEPDVELGAPQLFVRQRIRVFPQWVERIVHRAPSRPPAAHVQRLDGSRLAFQNFRWRSAGLDLLTESGVRRVPFEDLAALELPPADPWQSWYRQLAALTPALDGRVLRLETSEGLRLTTSMERAKPRSASEDPAKWYLWVQPAWSLDLLAVPHRKTRLRAFFAAREAPLSLLEPVASRHRAMFSAAWSRARIDENVQGGILASQGREFAWGFGVHAHHELEFELPATARRFRTRMGLDALAGSGGCVRGSIRQDERVLFESPVLVGSGQATDSGWLPLAGKKARLVLVADALANDRPRGADPYDIRDLFNWLEPQLELDPISLRREVEKHYGAAHPRLAGWTLDPVEAAHWRPAFPFDESDRSAPCFRPLLVLEGPVSITRQISVEPGRDTVVLWFGRGDAVRGAGKFEVKIDGRRVLREALPGPPASENPLPVEVALKSLVGRTVELTVRLEPTTKPALVDWRGMTWLVPEEPETK